jgi:CheY-like chemotaxis protein
MNKRILVIDDEELVVKSIEKLLKKQGYEPLICRNGEEALNRIKFEKIDLIVCDMRMPGLNGVETIRQIRKTLADAKKPIVKEILITGYAEEGMNEQAEELAVADYIYKPFDLRDFLESVKKNLA